MKHNNPILIDLYGTYELIYKRNNNCNNYTMNSSSNYNNQTPNKSIQWEYETFIRQLSPTITEQKLNIVYLRSNGLDNSINEFINDNMNNILSKEDMIVIGFKVNEKNEIVNMRFGYYKD